MSHMRTVDEVLKDFDVSSDNGLSDKQVEARLKKYGLNGL